MLKNGTEKSRGNTSRKKVETFKCLICMDRMPMNHKFEYGKHTTNNLIICTHKFCIDCVSNHINAKVQDNVTSITCPGVGCIQLIHFHRCIGIIPKSVMDRWENVLSKSKISSIAKLYCPYKECSAPLLAAADRVTTRTTPKANCPHCRKDFCSKCKVAWHPGINCKDYQKLRVDDKAKEAVMLKNLAKEKLWARCPHCKFYVEKTQGCHHITCRRGCEFCYGCGSNYGKCKGQCSRRA